MGIIELILLAVGLSMDAFAVSVCKGLAMDKVNLKGACICGAWFGGFQALMPFAGYLLGTNFEQYINAVSPWVAFVLLVLIGGNMIREALGDDDEKSCGGLDAKTMFFMAVATSIDALAVGITFACVPIDVFETGALSNIAFGVVLIGITTFIISVCGVKIGNVFGTRYKRGAEITGGIILMAIGIKILLEHLLGL